jgi:toxin YoeB
MEVIFTDKANIDLLYFKRINNQIILKKIRQLLDSIITTPAFGIGKPEKLKHDLFGKYSRRIDKEHRLIYEIDEESNTIIVHSLRGHY